ncbi:MAG TPA: polysaccharide deacetylase family protein, partial [Gammaproteobacteria bacterium]|nr:polysaccharide deacetylase family protein [Gammaproteobacteria bacterium]
MQPFAIALDLLRFSGLANVFRGRCAGVGALLTLHHVRPPRDTRQFAPNRILDISPEYLEAAIRELDTLGYEFVSLDEFHARMIERRFDRRFVSFTLDDGYLDNYTYAYPIFRRHAVPFAIYLCTGIMDRTAQLWWQELEAIVAKAHELRVALDGDARVFATRTVKEKYRAFGTIYWRLRAMPHEAQLDSMQQLRDEYAPQLESADVEPLTWEMVAEMRASGLFTIGGHTVNHFALSKLSADSLYDEIERGCAVV